jgi:arabinose-5-phosphate isomerase
MHSKNLPICSLKENIKEIIKTMSSSKFGLIVVVSDDKIEGIITDGDIRRAMEDENSFFTLTALDLMTKNPKTISHDAKLVEAQTLMTDTKINSLLVTKDDALAGIVQIYDLGL